MAFVSFLRTITPAWAFRVYHFLWALLGHALYGFPSRKLIVFGVTGTKGKTTTSAALAHILEQEGFRVAMSSTAFFKIGRDVVPNQYKASMPGRFVLPRFLSRAVKAGCHIAIVESTSEGVLQFRHRFISYDYFVFTNLRSEHIERHGSFGNYKEAKLELFRGLAKLKRKRLHYGSPSTSSGTNLLFPERKPLESKDFRDVLKGVVVNLDDEHAKNFLEVAGKVENVGVTFENAPMHQCANAPTHTFQCHWENGKIQYQDANYELRVPGEYNARNIALASAAATFLGVRFGEALERAKDFAGVPGRFEVVQKGNVTAVIDYAHEPFSLEEVLKLTREKFPGTLVHVFGATGGGRDSWKRPKMGEVAERYADQIILTDDDPYDEDQMNIVDQILSGIRDRNNVEILLDRRKAIERGIEIAREAGGVVLITGKGSENLMCFERGRKIPWSDRGVVAELVAGSTSSGG